MNEEKKVPFKWEYGEETISLQLGMPNRYRPIITSAPYLGKNAAAKNA